MGLGADMVCWAEENGYEGDDPWGAWNDDLQDQAEAQQWQWLQSDCSKKKDSPIKKKAKMVRTDGTHATCSSCQQQKPRLSFSNRQWNTKGAQARCISCINANWLHCRCATLNKSIQQFSKNEKHSKQIDQSITTVGIEPNRINQPTLLFIYWTIKGENTSCATSTVT